MGLEGNEMMRMKRKGRGGGDEKGRREKVRVFSTVCVRVCAYVYVRDRDGDRECKR
jgi:hypothetical protein